MLSPGFGKDVLGLSHSEVPLQRKKTAVTYTVGNKDQEFMYPLSQESGGLSDWKTLVVIAGMQGPWKLLKTEA